MQRISPTIEAPEDEPFSEGEARPPGEAELWDDGDQKPPEPEGPA